MSSDLVFTTVLILTFGGFGLTYFICSRGDRKRFPTEEQKRAKNQRAILDSNLRDSPGLDNFERCREWGLDFSLKMSREPLKLEMQVEGHLKSNTSKTNEPDIRLKKAVDLPIDEPGLDPTVHPAVTATIFTKKIATLESIGKVAGAISAVCGMIAGLYKYHHELENWAAYVVMQISWNAHSIHRALGLLVHSL